MKNKIDTMPDVDLLNRVRSYWVKGRDIETVANCIGQYYTCLSKVNMHQTSGAPGKCFNTARENLKRIKDKLVRYSQTGNIDILKS